MSRPAPPHRGDFPYWERITTRWADNDVYGHVNNVVFYSWFDTAVNQWLIGQGLLDLGGGDPIALVVETRCSYFAPLAFPGDVAVGLRVVELGRSSVRYALGVFGEGEDIAAAAGEFVHVAVDRASRRPVPWPEEWRKAFGTLSL